ncbi:ArdC-like ssDNA-binding domain-containing protein [Alicyclobacillus ferrooxydans]|uniref:N-terminal domain-containing protein n=1 Tax=Alicyclobacillus ferrooxydans TaxID=471514 RepID=A0A0P9CI13_9BACL|nr:ArdC-like ssDNA-binding domain-containing protein [Alicyclobacillus ferrooxydans]KPV42679.1 hypothetical protein AN477_16230 [Alicyclobacillus ferrooxydans]
MKNNQVMEATQRLLAMWESGDLPQAVAHTMLKRKSGDRPSDSWSLANQILTFINGTEDARGFRQWEQVGRHVLKGSKAIYILGPVARKIKEKNTETGEEEEKTIITGFKSIPVFRIEDTEGKAIEDSRPDYTPPVMPPLMNVAKAWGIDVKYQGGNTRYYGAYYPGKDAIVLCTHDVTTFFHELSHAAHHRIRPLKGGQDSTQEIVAETSAAILCLMYGYEGYVSKARDYVAHYAKMEPQECTKAVMRAISDIEKVLTMIIEEAEQQSTTDTAKAV